MKVLCDVHLPYPLVNRLRQRGARRRACGGGSEIWTGSADDPDYIIAVETVGQRGGASIWDRSDRARYAFLGLD